MRQAFLIVGRNARTPNTSVVRVIRRRFATADNASAEAPRTGSVAESLTSPKKKRSLLSRLFWTTTFATVTFYGGSLFVSFNSSAYYDFFSDNVPLAQPLLEFAEARKWDRVTLGDITSIFKTSDPEGSAEKNLGGPKGARESKIEESKAKVSQVAHKLEDKAKHAVQEARQKVSTKVEQTQQALATKVEKSKDKADKVTDKAGWLAKHQAAQLSDDIIDLKAKAEAALRGEYPTEVKSTVSEVKEAAKTSSNIATPAPSKPSKPVYEESLPIGFEPPHGYLAPKPSSPPRPSADEIPVANLKTDPTPLPGSIPYPAALSKVEKDSVALSPAEIEQKLKEAERTLDEQVREHTLKMLEFEITAQDTLDKQEADFRRVLLLERERISQEYRNKMEEELKVQRELIEDRLKESLAQQSLELQRRWIREIKVLVEQERGGRLAKINEIQLKLKALQGVALENAEVLDDASRAKSLSRAVDVLKQATVQSPTKHGFRDELRTLNALAVESKDDLLSSVLTTLSGSNTPDLGVEPLSDLTAWFCTSVSPKAAKMAMVPSQDAGLLTHLVSSALSMFTFKRLDEGQLRNRVEGGSDDVLSTLARTEWYLKTDSGSEGLEKATRELNQLPTGPAREICEDWLTEARRRLEVAMLVEVLENLSAAKSLLYSA